MIFAIDNLTSTDETKSTKKCTLQEVANYFMNKINK